MLYGQEPDLSGCLQKRLHSPPGRVNLPAAGETSAFHCPRDTLTPSRHQGQLTRADSHLGAV